MSLYYRNEFLFSEIYLKEITQIPEDENAQASLQTLIEYQAYADSTDLKSWKESFVHQALNALNFFVQSEDESLSLLYPLGNKDGGAVSLCYILPPDESLDITSMGRNWAEKTIRNLREKEMQWGLLTNGKTWRVYHLDEPTPYETYLEINLGAIMNDKARQAYQIFSKFMRAENFISNEDGVCQFDKFKQESQSKIDYIENELENALKQREEGGQGVLSSLCMGYVTSLLPQENPNLQDETMRKKIYHGAMLYMFRLLFLYYADARHLLSEPNQRLLEVIRQRAYTLTHAGSATTKTYDLWKDLEAIFVDIDQTYNGGLFNPYESEFTEFIENNKISDMHLAPAIYHLAYYHEKNGEERPISYKDMSVRHLGTLYEGLLEHKLFIAEEDTEVRMAKGSLKFVPVSKGGKAIQGKYIPMGQVYFANDATERKSTGSYYTPEYIVDYIVQKAFENKFETMREKYLAQEQEHVRFYKYALDAKEQKKFAEIISKNTHQFILNQVISLRVLDPAMGSGHFLVNAANFIANFITKLSNDLDVSTPLETAPAYWRRWVVESCLYGVDLNPLAVELAKLSLWILSMGKDLPLSFLKHHLKIGDSLVGANLGEVGFYPPGNRVANGSKAYQFSLFEADELFQNAVNKAIENYHLISARGTNTLEDVENKKGWLDDIEEELQDFKEVCSFHTSLYFDNYVDETEYHAIIEKRVVPAELSKAYWGEKYFHWELEFPDVFLERQGFDIIIGNPPYGGIKKAPYYEKVIGGDTRNLFSLFIARGVEKNARHGNLGFVVPLSFAAGSSYERTRVNIYKDYEKLFASHYAKRPAKLFPGVEQRITIFIAEGKNNTSDCEVSSSRLWRFESGEQREVVLYPKLYYANRIKNGIIPKINGEIGASVFLKAHSSPNKLSSIVTPDGNYLSYYTTISTYWIKAFSFCPYFKRSEDSTDSQSSTLGVLQLKDEVDRDISILLINSSLFYYWWLAVGDEFHVLLSDVNSIGFNYINFKKRKEEIKNLVSQLMLGYKKHSRRATMIVGGKKIEYDTFNPRKSLTIIHKIDDLVADIYGFSTEEAEFLKTYDMEFRIGEN